MQPNISVFSAPSQSSRGNVPQPTLPLFNIPPQPTPIPQPIFANFNIPPQPTPIPQPTVPLFNIPPQLPSLYNAPPQMYIPRQQQASLFYSTIPQSSLSIHNFNVGPEPSTVFDLWQLASNVSFFEKKLYGLPRLIPITNAVANTTCNLPMGVPYVKTNISSLNKNPCHNYNLGLINKMINECNGHLFLCGGAVFSILSNKTINDYDMFFVANTVDEANMYLKRCLRIIDEYVLSLSREVYSRFVSNINTNTVRVCNIVVQFIKRLYTSPEQIIDGFDLPGCKFLYGKLTPDGQIQSYANIEGYTALKTMSFPVNTKQITTSHSSRLRKYQGKGFNILLNGLKGLDVDNFRFGRLSFYKTKSSGGDGTYSMKKGYYGHDSDYDALIKLLPHPRHNQYNQDTLFNHTSRILPQSSTYFQESSICYTQSPSPTVQPVVTQISATPKLYSPDPDHLISKRMNPKRHTLNLFRHDEYNSHRRFGNMIANHPFLFAFHAPCATLLMCLDDDRVIDFTCRKMLNIDRFENGKFDKHYVRQAFGSRYKQWMKAYLIDEDVELCNRIWKERYDEIKAPIREIAKKNCNRWKVKNPGDQFFGKLFPMPVTPAKFYGRNDYTPFYAGDSDGKIRTAILCVYRYSPDIPREVLDIIIRDVVEYEIQQSLKYIV